MMQPPVIAALIAGGTAIVAPIVTFIVTKAYEHRSLEVIDPRRRRVTGEWAGTAHQAMGPDGTPFDADIMFTLHAQKKLLTGEGRYHARYAGSDIDLHFRLTGGFIQRDFVRMDYDTMREGEIQFGSVLCELSADCAHLTGRFQGYGVMTQSLVYGTLDLHKVQ
jgi:hypothetical protein